MRWPPCCYSSVCASSSAAASKRTSGRCSRPSVSRPFPRLLCVVSLASRQRVEFTHPGAVRYVYYAILHRTSCWRSPCRFWRSGRSISAIARSAAAVANCPRPEKLAVAALYREKHIRLARWTFPIWLYVSVTGVVVYVMLYHLWPPQANNLKLTGARRHEFRVRRRCDMKAIYHQFEPVIVRWIVAAIVVALVLLIASVAAACPTCKEGLAQNDPQGQVDRGRLLLQHPLHDVDAVHRPRHRRQLLLHLDSPRSHERRCSMRSSRSTRRSSLPSLIKPRFTHGGCFRVDRRSAARP